MFGNRGGAEIAALQQQLAAAHATIAELRGWVDHLRGAGTASLEAELRQLRSAVEQSKREYATLTESGYRLRTETESLQAQLVETRDLALLQEVGVYEYAHPLDDALAYKDALATLKQQIKTAAKGDAVTCHVDWAVNGSVKEGQKLGRDMAKLMLRAYNAEADNAVRVVKPHTREAVKKKLTTTRDTIARLGLLMRIAISVDYHRLRLQEIDLTADYLMRVEVEREQARAERERLREEAKVMKEIERERERLRKERSHYRTVVRRLRENGDLEALERAQEQLDAIDDAIAGVEERAANARAGYVYVISNIGAFGPDVVKIGMTRRLEPMDRVRELGDASVPFRFDTHALIFSEDAVALETALHQRLADKRVNLVNPRREFFYATPAEVRDLLVSLGDDHVLEYTDTAEAVEWRASEPGRRSGSAAEEPPAEPRGDAALAAAATHTDAGGDGDLSDDGVE
ncbi:DUF4041 domain-containing protein [Streptoalloteichus hindustanus]|uniref:T5orf172 domain-containing protein n=1 Tax=Streptoalloteichus hindustanus TaxID=2017 RepID=A0A1M5P5C4_STRHI|nr:DUF4041 domain-containing protein [Streptoalloteichus hindustanus]SHG97031.1 T5orf172 domain-containing protein [Streptoalloteichus hindustanus]